MCLFIYCGLSLTWLTDYNCAPADWFEWDNGGNAMSCRELRIAQVNNNYSTFWMAIKDLESKDPRGVKSLNYILAIWNKLFF